MDEDVRVLLESYWDGLMTRDEVVTRLHEIAQEYGTSLEELAKKYGFNPNNP